MKSSLWSSIAAVVILGACEIAVAKSVRVDCGTTRDLGNFSPAKRVVFKIANLGSCCAQVLLFDAADQGGNALLDVTLCPNDRVNVDRPTSFAVSARIVASSDGVGTAILDFTALPPEDDVNWARNGETVSNTNVGNVGIGTTTPGEKLTVCGTIESKSGGIKFPDGSIQTTAAVSTGRYASGLDFFNPRTLGSQFDRSVSVGFSPRSVRVTVRTVFKQPESPNLLHSSSVGTGISPDNQQCVYSSTNLSNEVGSEHRLSRLRLGPDVSGPEDLLYGDILSIDPSGFTIRWSKTDTSPNQDVHVLWEAFE